MEVTWEYFFGNINTNKEVAILKDSDGDTILTVYEDEYSHRAELSQKFYYIDDDYFIVFFGREEGKLRSQYHGNLSSLDVNQINEKKLMIGCNILASNFLRQYSLSQKRATFD